MTASLANHQEYEQYIYAIPTLYAQIESSTLVFIRTGRYLAKITGEIFFKPDIRLKVLQVVDFSRSEILRYSYTVRLANEQNSLPASHVLESSPDVVRKLFLDYPERFWYILNVIIPPLER